MTSGFYADQQGPGYFLTRIRPYSSKVRALFDAQPRVSQRMVVISRKSHEPDLTPDADAL
jgi:hypothetical protein